MFDIITTLIYSADKCKVDELIHIREQIKPLYGKKFVADAEKDNPHVHPTIRENINITSPDTGKAVDALINFAKEEGIKYEPSEKNKFVLGIVA